MVVRTRAEWDHFLLAYPDAHILQTGGWGDLKSQFGWKPFWVTSDKSGAQVLLKRLPFGLSIGYIAKGPLGEEWSALWRDIDSICRQYRAILLKVEPDCFDPLDSKHELSMAGFRSGAKSIQPRRTVVVDLTGTEEELLARMKQKTRYNIKLAERKGVRVRASDDLNTFYQMMRITGLRDGFGVHTLSYYQRAFEIFSKDDDCILFMAEYENQPLAGLMAFSHGKRSWYFYGASSDKERNRMPTYLLQWEAMRWAKAKGCISYDLWGVPDEDESMLEEDFESKTGELWGVYRFKRGFGGQIRRSVGAWDRVYRPALYWLYQWWLARGKPEG